MYKMKVSVEEEGLRMSLKLYQSRKNSTYAVDTRSPNTGLEEKTESASIKTTHAAMISSI